MAPIPPSTQKLWHEYTASFQASNAAPEFHPDASNGEHSWYELHYNGRTLKYTVKLLGAGSQPADGFPLFIGLHGGGGDTLPHNDGEWNTMIDYWYRKPVEDHVAKTGEGAVYIALRGVSTYDDTGALIDTWNLHFQDESYVLLQRMLRGFFLPIPTEVTLQQSDGPFHTPSVQDKSFVDPNRVYLLGFSAGGDGAFQHAARLPDLFSAVSAAGGHPNGVPFTNTANLPLCISSGEKDTIPAEYTLADGDNSGAKDRAKEIAKDNFLLDDLAKNAREQLHNTVPQTFQPHVDSYLFYPHDCVIVQGVGHNSWANPNMTTTPQKVLSNLKSWLSQQENPGTSVADADATVDKVINLLEWTCTDPSSTPPSFSPRVRNPLPNLVVWDLATRPTPLSAAAPGKPKDPWAPKNTLYWLYLHSSAAASLTNQVRAAYDKATNSIWIGEGTEHVGILLNENMVDFGKEVLVYVGTQANDPQKLRIAPSEKLRRETLFQRGDPSWVFDALVHFVRNGTGEWVAVASDTLTV